MKDLYFLIMKHDRKYYQLNNIDYCGDLIPKKKDKSEAGSDSND